MTISQQPPKTPPPRTRQPTAMVTPPTPRYAPIDEPDTHPISPTLKRNKHKRTPVIHGKDTEGVQSSASLSSLMTLPARPSTTMPVLPMTPDQTPLIRKQDISTTASASSSTTRKTSASGGQTSTTTRKTLNGRILFTNSPASTSSLESSASSASPSSTSTDTATKKPVGDLKRKFVSVKSSPIKKRKLQVFNDSIPPAPPVFVSPRPSKRPHHRTVLDGDDDSETSTPIAFSSFSSSSFSLTAKNAHPFDPPATRDVPGMWHIFRGKKIFRPFATGSDSLKNYVPRVLFPRKDTAAATTTTTTTSTEGGFSLEGMSTPITQKPKGSYRKKSLELSPTPAGPGSKKGASTDSWSDSDDNREEIADIIASAEKSRRISDPFMSKPIRERPTEAAAPSRSARDIEDEEAETDHETDIPSAIQTRTSSYRKTLSSSSSGLTTPLKSKKQHSGSKKQFFR